MGIAKNIYAESDKAVNTVKLSNKTNISAKPTDPKAAVETNKSTEEKTALKNKVNNDWINFLKKRQDTELAENDIVEVEETPIFKPQQHSKRRRNNKKDVFTTEHELPVSKPVNNELKAQDNCMDIVKDEVGKDVDVEKDQILKNLMNQVAQLETSMGANISKLESQLKDEKEKSKKLEEDLEAEKENYSDTATKLISMQQNKIDTEETHRKKFSEVDEKFNSERRKNSELSKELNKIEKVCKEDKKVKDKFSKDLLSIAAERQKLKSEVGNLVMWKEESITKIKASIMFCQEEHVQKINDLEDNNELKSGMIVEINSRLSMMISEYSSNINLKEH